MVVMPTDQPLFTGLNTYYLNIPRLIEHLQGQIGSGGVYFKSPAAEGAVFFDKDDIVNAVLQTPGEVLSGSKAMQQLAGADERYNFNVSVYRIGAEAIYFWAGVPAAEMMYKDLSADFTDLAGLIKKMSAERLTGYIDVHFGNAPARGMIFQINGKVVGAVGSWSDAATRLSLDTQKEILRKVQNDAALFSVCRIPIANSRLPYDAGSRSGGAAPEIIAMLEEFLALCETAVKGRRSGKIDFQKLLKQKFVQKAETYSFLDPFAAEFQYNGHRIIFSGRTSDRELAQGVILSVMELIDERRVGRRFRKTLVSWLDRHKDMLGKLGLHL